MARRKSRKERKPVFIDYCYICGKRIIGYREDYEKKWLSNFKGLSAYVKCMKSKQNVWR